MQKLKAKDEPLPSPNGRKHASSPISLHGSVARREHGPWLEELYERWKYDPQSLEDSWRSFFEGFELGSQTKPDKGRAVSGLSKTTPLVEESQLQKQIRIFYLIFAYRTLGHYIANLDPLGFNKTDMPELALEEFDFTEADLDEEFDVGTLADGGRKTLREIITILRETYCGNIGVEYMHIQNFEIRRWLRDRFESTKLNAHYASEKKKRTLRLLLSAERFEKYLHTKFVGQKRFSLEGGETLIPMLDAIVEACPEQGVTQIVMGMAHRGRLNVLANVLGKDYQFLFNEFAENYIPQSIAGSGDVKYHLGYEGSQTTTTGQRIGISLAPNPSHLELVNPIVEGKARAWQRLLNDTEERRKVLPILIHGDAAFIGQGIVAETLNMSQLPGYKTGGTIHIVVNNQIGFTTTPQDARSSTYCTAHAKGLGIPVFHVNGDDPLAAVFVTELAFEFRQKFQRDVVIDLFCYRRLGHNEGDEPSFTQPTVYRALGKHPLIGETFQKQLVESGDITETEVEDFRKKFEEHLDFSLAQSRTTAQTFTPAIRVPLSCPQLLEPVETAVAPDIIQRVGLAITQEPKDLQLNSKIQHFLRHRRNMIEGKNPLDWSTAEALAFGTLLDQQIPIRLSGQDSRRGTFSQRHTVLYDVETRERYMPWKNISAQQATVCVYNSPLSEAAVLGFDFGYSLDFPNLLILWEAQFGDFVNGAQSVIDQYIVSSETKWGVTSNIVLLLPHGYHGQGPEHSSARLERFLQACAEDNIIVSYCSTPANYFHVLRRQALRKIRKPLVLMTPKGLLRDKRCVSPLEELSSSRFQEVYPDSPSKATIERVILCSGKVYFDLADFRKKNDIQNTALIRLEQLYPLHEQKLSEALASYQTIEKIVWCQEEPENMGAWNFIEPRLRKLLKRDIHYAGRAAAASPSTGSHAIHDLEQEALIHQAFHG
jgi:2-oxoglutarate dehydrogenase E1 component